MIKQPQESSRVNQEKPVDWGWFLPHIDQLVAPIISLFTHRPQPYTHGYWHNQLLQSILFCITSHHMTRKERHQHRQPAFLQKPMTEMTVEEWESLCDGCGLCCQIRLEDEDTGEIALSNMACRYLCLNSHHCSDYANRQKNVPDCVKVTPENIHELHWLPHSCAYRVVARGDDLPNWHHLICGDKARVHTHGPSMKSAIISEDEADL